MGIPRKPSPPDPRAVEIAQRAVARAKDELRTISVWWGQWEPGKPPRFMLTRATADDPRFPGFQARVDPYSRWTGPAAQLFERACAHRKGGTDGTT